MVLDLSSPIIEHRDITAMLYGRTATTMLNPFIPVTTTRDRAEGIWPDPVPQPPRPTGVLILRGIWLGSEGQWPNSGFRPVSRHRSCRGHGVYGLSVQMISQLPSTGPAFRLSATRSDV